MRLTRPTFGLEVSSPLLAKSSLAGNLEHALNSAVGSPIQLGQTLILPQSFG
jgi:hypothetical protein